MKRSAWLTQMVMIGVMGLGSEIPITAKTPTLIVQAESSRTRETITIEGILDKSSQTLEDGSYVNIHTFEGKAGEIIVIDLSSDDFDVVLVLLDPDVEKIAVRDFQREGDNARIVIELPKTGTYSIGVNTAKANETGNYQLNTRQATETDIALAKAEQLNQQVIQLYQQGKYNEAIILAEQALGIRKEQLGDNHPDTATSLNNLAELYFYQGRYAEAEPLLQEALAIIKAQLGDNHPNTARSLKNLAELYFYQGKYTEAELLYQQALAIIKAQLGDNHPDTAASLSNLALLYESQGRYTEAELLYQQALAIIKAQLGDNHPDTAAILSNLAGLYESQGRYDEAEPLHQQALAITKAQLGDNHTSTATRLNNLANLYQFQGRYDEAEPLYQQALAIIKQQLGDNHPDTATSLNNLAYLYQSQGRYTEAEPLYQQALAIREAQLGDNHPHTVSSLNNLALLYQFQGRYGEAETLHQQALAIIKAQLGNKHPDTAKSLNNLALLYYSQGRYSEAEPLYQQALAIRKERLGDNHPHTAQSLNNLANIYESQGRYSEAELLHQQALAIRKEQLGENHPDTAGSLNNLSALYQSQDNIPLAINYLTQGLEVQEYNLSENLNVGDEQQKRDYIRTIRGTTDSVISLNLQAASNNPQATQLALKTILQRKGRILDVLTNSLLILRLRADDPESQQLLKELEAIKTQQSNLAWTPIDKFPSPEAYRKLLTEVQTQSKELEDKISRRSAEFRQLSQPITLEAIQQQIPNNSALVEIVRYEPFNPKAPQNERFGNPRYAVYILFPNGEIKAQDLGEAAPIDDSLKLFRRRLLYKGKPSIKNIKKYARALDEQLMQPIRELLEDTKTIYLSPDGALNLIPFEALVMEDNQYLVEEYQITYLTSGRDLLRLKDKFPSQTVPLIMANPTYTKEGQPYTKQDEQIALNPDNIRSYELSEYLQNRSFPGLPETKTEAEEIKKMFPKSVILTEQQATENALKQVKRPDILHIATHGFFRESPPINETSDANLAPLQNDNPLLRSGLVFAGVEISQSAGDDGVLTALETTSLNLVGTQLVVLSACETGQGDITTGEGVYGLRRALVVAGSESQLFSLWKVADGATKDLMINYYQRLKDGEGRTAALRNLQLEMIKKNDKSSHPYYWASFVPSGETAPMKF